MKVLQINTVVNSGSHGRIAEEIGMQVMDNGGDSYIAYGRGNSNSKSETIKITNQLEVYKHIIASRVFDRHGFDSYRATRNFIKRVDEINPDVIHLHNIHGYYVHIGLLFEYLAEKQYPVIWTLHDCWPFTGHCSYYDHIECTKWKTQCYSCPNIQGYPSSWFMDQSARNFADKKRLFTALDSLIIVTPSIWLARELSESFLNKYTVEVINNGIDMDLFSPEQSEADLKIKYELSDKRIILGVASIWSERKGLSDFIELSKILSPNEHIVLIGLSNKQMKGLPPNITGISRTENVQELVAIYNMADVFVNPTYLDNFPTTNIEALACGIPVISYDTGGSPESIDDQTGAVVPKGDIEGLYTAIKGFFGMDKAQLRSFCRNRALERYNKVDRYQEYLLLYKKLLDKKN